MSGLWRYGFRDGGGVSALRSTDGEAVPQMRQHKHRADFRIKKGASAYMFGIFAANTIKNDYQCKSCGHKFS